MNLYSTQYFRLTFNESNILMENKNIMGLGKSSLIIRLQELSKSGADDILKHSAISLSQKIANLSESDFFKLKNAAEKGSIVYPPNFSIDR